MKEISLTGAAQDLSFSPDNKYLVTADSNRKVTLFNAGFYDKPHNKEWGFHTAKVLDYVDPKFSLAKSMRNLNKLNKENVPTDGV